MGRAGQNWLLQPTVYGGLIPPIGVNPVVLWDARQGVDDSGGGGAVLSWTDLMRGLVLTPPSSGARPIFGTSSGQFLERKIVKFDGTDDQLRVVGASPAIVAAGSRPHWFYVLRNIVHTTTSQISMWILLDEPPTAALPTAYFNAGSTLCQLGFYPGQVVSGPGVGTGPHLIEHWIDASLTSTSVDAGTAATTADGSVTGAASRTLYLGTDHVGNPANIYVAAWGCYAAALTAPQRAALVSYYRAAWGTP